MSDGLEHQDRRRSNLSPQLPQTYSYIMYIHSARLDITVVSTATLSSLLSELPYRYRKYRTLQGSVTFFIKSIVIRNKIYMVSSVAEPEPVGAGAGLKMLRQKHFLTTF